MLPNVIIAGAPRCGTTSLFEYLASHPQVCASSVKETCFFIDKDYFSNQFFQSRMPKYFSSPLSEYEKYFKKCSSSKKVILEGTTDYMYQSVALDQLIHLPTEPKIILILRKPSERVYSMYKYAQGQMGLIENTATFREFVNKAYEQNVFERKGYKILANVVNNGKYIHYINRIIQRCGRERVFVYLFEDMMHDSMAFMKKLSIDLGIDPGFYDNYEAKQTNESVVVRSLLLHRLMKSIPIPLNLRLEDSVVKNILRKMYRAINTSPKAHKNADDLAVLKELDNEYSDSISELEYEFSFDLSSWK